MSNINKTRERLAAIEHERWADWQKWMHSLMGSLVGSDGNTTTLVAIDKSYIDRWERQINTPYPKLSEREKASDMEQVDRYWPIILDLLANARNQALDDLLEAMPEKVRINHTSFFIGHTEEAHEAHNAIIDQITATIHQLKSSKQGEV